MGYSRFRGNEEEVMEAFLKFKKIDRTEISEAYPEDIKSLMRRKMIACDKKVCTITDRGRSAIKQQIRTGEYWVASLKPYKFEPYGSGKIPKSMAGYIK